MSDSTHQPSSSRRAPRNRFSQTEVNKSLADYLARHNQPVPSSLKRPPEAGHRPSRSNRQRHVEREATPVDDTTPPTTSNDQHTMTNGRHSPSLHEQESINDTPTIPRPLDDTILGPDILIDELRTTAQFIDALCNATLEQSNMQHEDIERLRAAEPDPLLDTTDKHFVKALRSFLSTTNSSQATYNAIRSTMLTCYPEDPFLSFDQMKRRVEQLSGVVPIFHDMCSDTCVGFTGPFRDCDQCPSCGNSRYRPGTREPNRQFISIPLGPVIQALYGSLETAEKMHYREQTTAEILEHARTHGGIVKEYSDTICGRDYLDAVKTGKIKNNDVLVQLSLDGAQLYRDKESDCWIFVYVIHNLSPDLRYKKRFVIPAGFIPGPEKPKNTDSFLFPALYHISALQNEGLRIWDASTQTHIPRSTPFLFVTADGPAMAMVAGMVGHSGKFGCRLYCGLPGRHRDRDGHYFPVMLKPNDYNVAGCDHGDITFSDLRRYQQDVPSRYHRNLQRLLGARNISQYKERRLETGLCKQTILSGLREGLGIPNIFPLDIMHLINLNDPDLFLGLWRGTIKVYPPDRLELWDWRVLVGKVWHAHGKTVALATPFIPSSFGRAPRNPAEKINSGYKAWEFQIYLLGLGPALLRHILPKKYWANFCKYVSGVRLLQQWVISPADLQKGHRLLCGFVKEFEELYYQRREDRIHFVRQSIHLLTHIASETVRAGPLACYAQWTIETAIGNLGNEIRQDRDPYANIAQRGVLRAQLNSILAMLPHLDLGEKNSFSRGAKDLGQGYALLRPCEDTARQVTDTEASAILTYWEENAWPNQDAWPKAVMRWAHLQLPNGQKARSRWYELRSTRPLRKTTCVRLTINGTSNIADVEYFFRLQFGDIVHSLALVSVFSPPYEDLLEESHHTVYICRYGGEAALRVVDAKAITSVVAMIPDYQVTAGGDIVIPENQYSLVDAPLIKLASLCGTLGEDEVGNDNDIHE